MGTSEEILSALKPKTAVISVGNNNRFEHPSDEILERLKNNGIKIERTDETGDLKFIVGY